MYKRQVVDLEHLANEIKQIEDRGIQINKKHLKLSKKATISMPWHRIQDELEENRLERTGSCLLYTSYETIYPKKV